MGTRRDIRLRRLDMGDRPLLDHERLEVYQLAREFNRELRALSVEAGRGAGEPLENLRRAARSISRNLAEGASRWSLRDKLNFYHIARGSAAECAAGLDELVDEGHLSVERVAHAREVIGRVLAMLINLARAVEARAAAQRPGRKNKP